MKAVALLYHDVTEPGHSAESGFTGSDAEIYKLTTDQFERHLDAIEATGSVPGATVSEVLAREATGGEVPVFLTFDDGGASAEATANMLDRRGWKGHFFITTNYIGSARFVDRTALRNLHARGHVIGSHSCSHPRRMSHLADAELRSEWGRSIETLQEILGSRVATASVPGGFYSRRVAEFASQAGIRTLFNSEPVMHSAKIGDCVVIGRFGLQRASPPILAAKYTGQDRQTLLRQAAYWNAKKLIKAAGGEQWLAFRKWWLAR